MGSSAIGNSIGGKAGISMAELVDEVLSVFRSSRILPDLTNDILCEAIMSSLNFADRFDLDVELLGQERWLTALADSLDIRSRETHTYTLGMVAARAHRVMAIGHANCNVDQSYIHQAVSGVLPFLRGSRSGGSRQSNDATDVAFVVLGSWRLARQRLRILNGLHSTNSTDRRAATRELGVRTRWLGFDPEARLSDIKTLAAESKGWTGSLYEEIMLRTRLTPSQAGQVLEFLAARKSPICFCKSDPIAFVEALWGTALSVEWTDTASATFRHALSGSDTNPETELDGIAKAALPRIDFIRNGSKLLMLEPAGFSDASLAYLVGQAGARASVWHEDQLFAAAQLLAHGVPRATAHRNIEWSRVGTSETVAGELDAVVAAGGVLLSFQAKAGQSADYRARERTLTSAQAQHMRFEDSISSSGVIVHDPLLNRSKGDFKWVVIPISVAAEPTYQFGVGGSVFIDKKIPVVTTCLDHVRLVNKYLPPIYRLVYWLDRYAQETSDLIFVDEMDFLGYWIRSSSGDQVDLRVLPTTPKNGGEGGQSAFLVMSDGDSPIEAALWYDSLMSDARRTQPTNARKLKLPRQAKPLIRDPDYLLQFVRRTASTSGSDWLGLARLLMCGRFQRARGDLDVRKPKHLTTAVGSWASLGIAPANWRDQAFVNATVHNLDYQTAAVGKEIQLWSLRDWRESFASGTVAPRFASPRRNLRAQVEFK